MQTTGSGKGELLLVCVPPQRRSSSVKLTSLSDEFSLPERLQWFSEILSLLVRALIGRLWCESRKRGELTSVASGVAQPCCITEPSQVLHDVLVSFLLL